MNYHLLEVPHEIKKADIHYQDRRSMFLNGESTVAVSGFEAMVGVFDFYFLLHKATWPKTLEEIKKLMPPTEWLDFLNPDII